MTEAEVQSFLAQFDRAREDFKNWPQWMQDAAVERAATFPKPSARGVPVAHAPSQPSDAELLHLWDKFVGEPTDKCPLIDKDKTRYARAVLAAYGVGGRKP